MGTADVERVRAGPNDADYEIARWWIERGDLLDVDGLAGLFKLHRDRAVREFEGKHIHSVACILSTSRGDLDKGETG